MTKKILSIRYPGMNTLFNGFVKALIIIAIILPAGFSQVYAQKELYLKKEFTGTDGSVLPYRILYPEAMEPGAKYPVVLFLHGAGERGSDNEKQLVHGSELFLEENNRQDYPAIVIFPQCPESEKWVDQYIIGTRRRDGDSVPVDEYPVSAPMQLVKELMDEIIQKEEVDRNRVYVMGLSMGAFGIFDLLHRRPDWFAAAVPICGGGDTTKVHKYAKQLPLWVFHGTDDSVVPVEASKMMVSAIEEAGGNVTYTEYPGVDHNSWDPAFTEEDLLPWIFGKKRER